MINQIMPVILAPTHALKSNDLEAPPFIQLIYSVAETTTTLYKNNPPTQRIRAIQA